MGIVQVDGSVDLSQSIEHNYRIRERVTAMTLTQLLKWIRQGSSY